MLKVKAEFPDLREIEVQALEQAGRTVTQAMNEATEYLKGQLREQVVEAGMGRRLAQTWRHRVYPDEGKRRFSLEPAGFVWSKAPAIIDGFARGATIRPANGAEYLWLPTKNVPRKGKRTMTPDEVDSLFNAEFVVFPSPRNRRVLLAFIPTVRARSTRRPGLRRATKGRQAQGRKTELVHMFTLIKQTKLPQRFDLQAAANEAAAFFVRRVGA